MGTVHRLSPGPGITLARAAGAYLATLGGAEQANTRRAYGRILTRLAGQFGADTAVDAIGGEELAAWFASQWGERAPSTWNVSLNALRSAAAYWDRQGWLAADPTRLLERRKPRPDRARAMTRAEVDRLLTREDIPLRERTLWTMLYETAARASEIIGLDVEDLERPNRRARVTRKGGAIDIVVWQTRTARLLPRLLERRAAGPVFVTERKARVQLAAADLDEHGRARISYQRAEELFKQYSGGRTLHDLRHSALTHDAEDGTSTPMLMARSGHTSVRSLVRYARVSAEALQRHQAGRDPAGRQAR